ncbi:MAG TPA: tetratricopeptide repeat protein [Terriglobia bacterium]|jgi:tetratricopeptide (TPR) repeat protein|nr:tetratricopeptide repeat protein [Terriglobia bacterium]
MTKIRGRVGTGIIVIVIVLGTGALWGQQKPAPGTPAAGSAPAADSGSTQSTSANGAQSATAAADHGTPDHATPDHGTSYYHFMLARRYEELAGISNRPELVDRAVAEYKAAMAADPDSLFLRTQLAELYYRADRVGDAVREAQAVLQVNPDEVDAHRLLAGIYLHSLGESEAAANSEATIHKAISEFEAVTRLDPKDTDSLIALGHLYRLTNQDGKAEETFRKAIGADPGSKPALSYLAQLYLDQGNYADAIAMLQRIPAGEMDPSALVMLGQAYLQTHEYDKAVDAYNQALQQDPENQELHQFYAEALLNAGKTAEARKELQQILRTDPNDGAAWLRLGHLDRVEGKFDEGREELAKAQNLLQDNAEVSYEQAVLEEAAGNDDKAISILQTLLKSSEKSDGHYTLGEAANRAVFLERLGLIERTEEKYDQAVAAFRQVVDLGPSQGARGEALIIDTLRIARQPAKAMAEADAAVAKYPKDQQLALVRASLLGEQGKADEAVSALNSLLDGSPSDFEVLITLAQVNLQAKRYSEALASAGKALALSPKPDDQENAHFTLGSIYERQKQYDQAEAEFKKVLATDPQNGAAANYLGYMLADRGVRLDESVRYIQKALQTEPNNGAYLDSLGWAYLKMHRPDLAEAPLKKAARLISDDPTILEHLGNLDLALGRPQAAEQDWERALQQWPGSVSSDFDADEAASLQKRLDELKVRLATGKATEKTEP